VLTALIPRLRCPACQGRLRAHTFRGSIERILDGVLVCGSCEAAYTIVDRMLELVQPALVDREARARFASTFELELAAASLQWPDGGANGGVAAQLAQRRHFDWFAENDTQSYTQYQVSPFWVAEDALTFDRWRGRIPPSAWILDVGCANGRSAWPLLSSGATIVGCDISAKLVRQAIVRAEADGVADRTSFLVADCDRLPFADDSFHYVVTYGVLHHLPDPARACRDIQRVLAGGGAHLGSENNRSVFRALFDWLMRWRPLWSEHAGAEPMISEQMLRAWTRDLPVRVRCMTSVFVPPHLVNVVGHRFAPQLLDLSDRAARLLPPLGRQGGLLVFEVEKVGA
jgi:SAM-dependent methyltransferase/uncharacterized protein YbaR (Trm112 family)